MGFLLLQYEYQRASREVTVHQRAGVRLDNMVTRYTKRVERMQSVFDKAKTRLGQQYDQLNNMASSNIQSAVTSSGSAAAFIATVGSIMIGGVSLGQFCSFNFSQNPDEKTLLQELSTAASVAKNALQTMINSAREADTERLEAQQDEQLNPISEKEADAQAEKNLEDTLCTMWEQRRDNAKQKLPDAIKDGMASYGIS